MRTLMAGLHAFRRNPLSILPISAEGLCAAVAILLGVIPGRGTVAAAGAVFPLDVYFDVKHALASTSSWPTFLIAVSIGIVGRAAVLALTLWLADASDGSLFDAWRRAAILVASTAAMFVPVAVLFYAGTVLRYAPFMWVAAPIGLAIAVVRARRAVHLDVGTGVPPGTSTPETAPFLGYAYLVAVSAAAVSFIGARSVVLAALLIASMGPLHALFLLGWRENARAEVYPGGGFFAVTATAVIAGMLGVGTFYDRVVRSPAPIGRTQRVGTLALLGGADSTSETGALTELDVRTLGYPEERVHRLSYTSEETYVARDTHANLDDVASVVANQVERLDGLEAVVGHSQAALIVDRLLEAGVRLPGSVNFAPLPPRPARVDAPAISESNSARADLAGALSAVLDAVGASGFDLEAPSVPARVDPVIVTESDVPRLAIWALGDSIWLDTDWRRPGEVNVVAITDHVGVSRNGRALQAARDFLAGRPVEPDAGSWRSVLVPIVRYAFEPWRPETQ